jgi:exodeoxyribonuclease VII small subunit
MSPRGQDGNEKGAMVAVGELTYNEASRELDDIVAVFEHGDLDVDELVGRLERATAIVDELDRRLRRTKTQVEDLVPRLEAALAADGRDEPSEEPTSGRADDENPGLF